MTKNDKAAEIYNFTFMVDNAMRVSARARNEGIAKMEVVRTFNGSTVKLINKSFSHNVGDYETHRDKKKKELLDFEAEISELALEEIKKEGFDSIIEVYARHTVSF